MSSWYKQRGVIRFVLILFAVSAGINYIWEMLQMPLYEDMPFGAPGSWILCFRASIGDGFIILFIWALGSAVFRSPTWFKPLTWRGTALLLLSGLFIAAGIELHALAAGRWAYSALMPLLPVLRVGLSPVLQLLFLPFICMQVSYRAEGRRKNS
ncbi:MAG: hypothetical protein ACP5IA_10435 [Sediminispirochaetaceae bacterium]